MYKIVGDRRRLTRRPKYFRGVETSSVCWDHAMAWRNDPTRCGRNAASWKIESNDEGWDIVYCIYIDISFDNEQYLIAHIFAYFFLFNFWIIYVFLHRFRYFLWFSVLPFLQWACNEDKLMVRQIKNLHHQKTIFSFPGVFPIFPVFGPPQLVGGITWK